MKSLLPVTLAFSIILSPCIRAQDAPAVNADQILRDLDAMEQQQKQVVLAARQNSLMKLKAASMSGQAASSLYVDAVEAMEFEGKQNKGASFSDWKGANGDLFRTREFQTIVQMHLRYLVMSLERASSDRPALFIAPSMAFVQELLQLPVIAEAAAPKPDKPGDRDKGSGNAKGLMTLKKDLLDKSIAEGIFSKWLRLGPWLPKPETWELVAGNISGILDKNIRKALREEKSPQLIETWDLELKLQADRATAGRLDYLAADFNTIARPKLLFSRANDMVVLGMNNRAVGEIYLLVKTYPQHPDFSKWVSRLRELLKPASAEAVNPGTSPQ